jgi:hypothetical protein
MQDRQLSRLRDEVHHEIITETETGKTIKYQTNKRNKKPDHVRRTEDHRSPWLTLEWSPVGRRGKSVPRRNGTNEGVRPA